MTKNTYWNHNGTYQNLADRIEPYVPAMGEVENNQPLEAFRLASSLYYDLYNNGCCNWANSKTHQMDKLVEIASEYKLNRLIEICTQIKTDHDSKSETECGACGGDGFTECWECDGGETECYDCYGEGVDDEGEECGGCSGSGMITCDYCFGSQDSECHECNDGMVESFYLISDYDSDPLIDWYEEMLNLVIEFCQNSGIVEPVHVVNKKIMDEAGVDSESFWYEALTQEGLNESEQNLTLETPFQTMYLYAQSRFRNVLGERMDRIKAITPNWALDGIDEYYLKLETEFSKDMQFGKFVKATKTLCLFEWILTRKELEFAKEVTA